LEDVRQRSLDKLPNKLYFFGYVRQFKISFHFRDLTSKMGVIGNILEEERERLSRLLERYRLEIEKLPKGSISRKMRKGRWYLYLAYRESERIKFQYLGKESSPKAQEIARQIQERRKYEKLFKQVKRDLKEIERAIHGRKV
jgi:hypothetical protein